MLEFLEMLARMSIFRIVTAPYVSARPAQAKMHPSVARGEAFLTAIAAWGHSHNFAEVCALLPRSSHDHASIENRTSIENRAFTEIFDPSATVRCG